MEILILIAENAKGGAENGTRSRKMAFWGQSPEFENGNPDFEAENGKVGAEYVALRLKIAAVV